MKQFGLSLAVKLTTFLGYDAKMDGLELLDEEAKKDFRSLDM